MEELRNAASDWAREFAPLWSDRASIKNEFPSRLAPNFVRYDRRSVISMPTADADGFIARTLDLYDLVDGQMSLSVVGVLAVRGDRLAAYRARTEFGGMEIEAIVVGQVDEALEKSQISVNFDPEDVDAAIAELDRMHAEIEAMPK